MLSREEKGKFSLARYLVQGPQLLPSVCEKEARAARIPAECHLKDPILVCFLVLDSYSKFPEDPVRVGGIRIVWRALTSETQLLGDFILGLS
jgi:hypothetical protein